MITVEQIVERVEQANLHGLVSVKEGDSGEFAVVDFWRLAGAFRNDRKSVIHMIIDPAKKGLENELFFYVPPLEECEPGDIALTMYMDANMKCYHGAHRWDDDKDVIFSYAMPVPAGQSDFPDAALLERLLKDMYESLLFREIKRMEMRISDDDMLSDEEKKAKFEKVRDMYRCLTGPKVEEDGTV